MIRPIKLKIKEAKKGLNTTTKDKDTLPSPQLNLFASRSRGRHHYFSLRPSDHHQAGPREPAGHHSPIICLRHSPDRNTV